MIEFKRECNGDVLIGVEDINICGFGSFYGILYSFIDFLDSYIINSCILKFFDFDDKGLRFFELNQVIVIYGDVCSYLIFFNSRGFRFFFEKVI